MRKYTDDQIAQATIMYVSGVSMKEIGMNLGISYEAVRHLRAKGLRRATEYHRSNPDSRRDFLAYREKDADHPVSTDRIIALTKEALL